MLSHREWAKGEAVKKIAMPAIPDPENQFLALSQTLQDTILATKDSNTHQVVHTTAHSQKVSTYLSPYHSIRKI